MRISLHKNARTTPAVQSSEDLEQMLLRYAALYNHQLPQSIAKSKTPMQAIKNGYQEQPHLLHKQL